jgi:hypothetical protein
LVERVEVLGGTMVTSSGPASGTSPRAKSSDRAVPMCAGCALGAASDGLVSGLLLVLTFGGV